jgi:hypothetical protein
MIEQEESIAQLAREIRNHSAAVLRLAESVERVIRMMVEDEEADSEPAQPTTYLDGTPIR